MPQDTGYTSLDDAAAAALMRINAQENAEIHEYIGLIYQDPKTGKYLFTEPQSTRARDRSKGAFRIPKGSLRAIIHNHPEAASNDPGPYLSPDDMEQARKFGVPSYIGVGSSLLRWTGKTSGPFRSRRGLTEEVLAQIPIQELERRSRGILDAMAAKR